MSTEMDLRRIHEIAHFSGLQKENLLTVLENLNSEFHFLDETIINEVARLFQLSQTEVYSVASFYHLLNINTTGRYVIHICKTIACDLKGKGDIIKVLQDELRIKVGETTSDMKFTLKYANCMGMCDQGPAMLINDDLYANLTPSKAVEIIHTYK